MAIRKMAMDATRGMILSGAPGNGKTTAARQYGRGAWFLDCNEDSEDDMAFLDCEDRYVYIPGRNIIVDDLGAERPFNDYGVKRELVGEWLTGLYSLWKRGKWRGRLFVTTNLSGADIARRYGGPLLDRIREMCVSVKFTGRSRRERADNIQPCATLEEAVRRLGWGGVA